MSLSLFSILVLTLSFPIANGSNNNLTIFMPDSSPYGLTFGEWTSKWWQWFVSMPNDANHPLNDAKGCPATNQEGPVSFFGWCQLLVMQNEHALYLKGKLFCNRLLMQECSTAEQSSLKSKYK